MARRRSGGEPVENSGVGTVGRLNTRSTVGAVREVRQYIPRVESAPSPPAAGTPGGGTGRALRIRLDRQSTTKLGCAATGLGAKRLLRPRARGEPQFHRAACPSPTCASGAA